MRSYTFPLDQSIDQSILQEIPDIKTIKLILKKQFSAAFSDEMDFFYRFIYGSGSNRFDRFHAKCLLCPSSLTWKRVDDKKYILDKFHNKHKHKNIDKTRQASIWAHLQSLTFNSDLQKEREEFLKKNQCSEKYFNAIVAKFIKENPNKFKNPLSGPLITKQKAIIDYLLENHPDENPLQIKFEVAEKFDCSLVHYYAIAKKFKRIRWGENMGKIRPPTKQEVVLEYLKQFPPETNFAELMDEVTEKFGISDVYFYGISKRYRDSFRKPDLNALKGEIEKSGYFYYCSSTEKDALTEQFPNVLLIITPQMEKAYRKFGYFVKLELTGNIVKSKTNQQILLKSEVPDKNFCLGFFTGHNYANKIVIYGLCVVSELNKSNLKEALEQFILHMGSCDTFITNQTNDLIESMKQLQQEQKFTGNHIYEINSVLKNLKNLSPISYQKIVELFSVASQSQYNRIYQQLVSKIRCDDNELANVQFFHSISHKCCISKIPWGFVGLSISRETIKSTIKQVLKQKIANQIYYFQAVKPLVNFCSEINGNSDEIQISTFPLQKSAPYYYYDQMHRCRSQLCENVFEILMRNYLKTMRLDLMYKDENVAIVSDRVKGFTIRRDENMGRWICECGFWVKLQIPCEHQLKCSNNLWELVGSFWKPDENESAQEEIEAKVKNSNRRFTRSKLSTKRKKLFVYVKK